MSDTVDPVRAAALANAVDVVKQLPARDDESDTARATRVVHVAVILEAYLTGEKTNVGEKTNDQVGPHPFVSGQPSSTSEFARCLLITGETSICGRRRDDPVHGGSQ